MPTVIPNRSKPTTNMLPALPLTTERWAALARRLDLAPQQERVVELILRGLQDKQIAAELKLRVPTVRTYLQRVLHRLHVSDRMELVLLLFSLSHSM